jgi:hypothetical protein
MGTLSAYELLTIVSFMLSIVICYAAVLIINARRDIDHQIPILKVFLFALVWTPLIGFCLFWLLSAVGA